MPTICVGINQFLNPILDAVALSKTDPQFATTVEHGIRLLEAFDVGKGALTNGELARCTGLSKATVSRLTSTLQSRDMLLFDATSRCYRLGSTALTIGYPLLTSLSVRREARYLMKRLADELGGSVSLGMQDRSRMIYVETSRGNHPISFRPDVGAALPMLQTAMGRAWLWATPPIQRAKILAMVQAQTPHAHQAWIASLAPAGDELGRLGFCCSLGNWQPDVYAVAVPLEPLVDNERLVVNCGVPATRFGKTELESVVGPKLVELARSLEAQTQQDQPRITRLYNPNPAKSTALPHARTLARGIDLLLCFQPGETTLSHSELAARLELGGPTVVRLTRTLVELGYLRRDHVTARYRLGAAVLTLAYPLLADMRVRQIARPAMLALSERLGGAVSLGFRHRTSMVYADTAWHGDDRLTPPDTGAPMPMLRTAMGRAWLCQASAADRRSVLNQLRLQEPQAFALFEPTLEPTLKEYRSVGFCSSQGEYRHDIHAFAVPFSRPVDSTLFVMNCGLLATRQSFVDAAQVAGPLLRKLVHDVEIAVGHRAAVLGD